MAYEMVMPYHLHMPSYFLETFTEYPCVNMKDLKDFPVFFYLNRFYDNSNPSASFNFSRFGFFLLIIWKRSTWL